MSAPQERTLRSGVNRPSERGESSSSNTQRGLSVSDQLARDVASAIAAEAAANALRNAGEDQEGPQANAGEEQGDPTREAGTDTESGEGEQGGDIDSDEEFEELKRQAARKQRAEEKQALRRYLKGDDPNLLITIQGKQYGNPESLNKRKRKQKATSNDDASDSEDNANLLRIRPNPPPLYGASSEQEWRTFVNALEAYWEGWPKRIRTVHKIATSSSYFKGLAATDWADTKKQGRVPATWNAYIEYLHNLVADPANRKVTAYEKLKEIKQGDGQSVRDLRSAIELLEQDIEARSQEEEAYALFTALRSSLKREVLRELRGVIALREEVASVAKRYEEQAMAQKRVTAAPAKSAEPVGKGSNHESQAQGKGKSKGKGGKQGKRKGNASSTKNEEKDLSNIECYNCHKKGHYATTCAEPDSREKSKDKQSKKAKKD
jgi:hypothetical protein